MLEKKSWGHSQVTLHAFGAQACAYTYASSTSALTRSSLQRHNRGYLTIETGGYSLNSCGKMGICGRSRLHRWCRGHGRRLPWLHLLRARCRCGTCLPPCLPLSPPLQPAPPENISQAQHCINTLQSVEPHGCGVQSQSRARHMKCGSPCRDFPYSRCFIKVGAISKRIDDVTQWREPGRRPHLASSLQLLLVPMQPIPQSKGLLHHLHPVQAE